MEDEKFCKVVRDKIWAAIQAEKILAGTREKAESWKEVKGKRRKVECEKRKRFVIVKGVVFGKRVSLCYIFYLVMWNPLTDAKQLFTFLYLY